MNNISKRGQPDNKILFPGCLILYRFPEYEISARYTLNELNVKTYLLEKSMCCGSFLQGKTEDWFYPTAYNLALAEAKHMDIITLCGGCTNVFRRFQHQCKQDPELMEQVNSRLRPMGLAFNNTIEVSHILEYLYQKIDILSAAMKKEIPLKAAMVNPCQVLRPQEIMHFDNPEEPQAMRKLCSLTGVEIVPYVHENMCCGSSVTLADKNLGYEIGKKRLLELEKQQTDIMVTTCGNCQLQLDRLQKEYYIGKAIPGMFLPQLLGLAMGFSSQELKIKNPHIRRLLKNA